MMLPAIQSFVLVLLGNELQSQVTDDSYHMRCVEETEQQIKWTCCRLAGTQRQGSEAWRAPDPAGCWPVVNKAKPGSRLQMVQPVLVS